MDYELIKQMKVDDWKKKIESSIKNIVLNILQKKYPFLTGVADIDIKESLHYDLKITVTFYVSEYPDYKIHNELYNDTNSMLQMLLLHKLDDNVAEIRVSLVLNY